MNPHRLSLGASIALSLLSTSALANPDFSVDTVYDCALADSQSVWIQVTNTGTSTTFGTWIDVFVGRASPPTMGEFGDAYVHTGTLEPGQSVWYPVPVSSLTAASIDVLLDSDGRYAEANEDDNSASIWGDFDDCALVDLEAPSLWTQPEACRGGDILNELSLHAYNRGPEAITTGFETAWYLSSDTTLDSGDQLLLGGRHYVPSLGADSFFPAQSDPSIPWDTSLGSQYLLVVLDEFDDVSEVNEDNNVIASPILIDSCPYAIDVVEAGRSTCVLDEIGDVRCWGYGQYGALGYGNTDNIGDGEHPYTAGPVDVGDSVAQITVGSYHTCALLDTGAVRCWGRGQYGALGYGNTQHIGDDETPALAGDVDVGGTVAQLSAGHNHTCALLDTGAVRCWGGGFGGPLGYGNTQHIGDNETPASAGDVDVGGSAVQIAVGWYHTCALLDTGAVRCWGRGQYGQLGYGNTDNIGDNETPASVGDIDVGGIAVQIAVGEYHTCALLDTGAVRCWGDGYDGALGYGNLDNIGDDETPALAGDVDVGGIAVQITAGKNHTCALLDTGAVRCWGGGGGQLGYGHVSSIGDNEVPATAGDVDVGGTVAHLSAGWGHTCALLDAGGVRCWGGGFGGQLGYADTDIVGNNEAPSSAGDVQIY